MVRRYRIEHRTVYRYSDEVSTSFGRGYLKPRDLPGQRCLQHNLSIEPMPSDVSHGVDVYGNYNTYFHVTNSHTELRVVGLSDVEVSSEELDPAVLAQPWERARPSSTADARAVEFTLASPLVRMPVPIREYADVSFWPGRPIIDAVNDLTHRIHTEFKYESGATSVSSTVTDVLEAKKGVCQDFAHVAIACLRSIGLACRYVSGYLATYPPPGKPRMIGVDASHAWAAVRLSDSSWLSFDPTNDTLENKMDVSVDVAPL